MSCKVSGKAKLISGLEKLIPNWCLYLDISGDKEKLEDPESVGQCQSQPEYCRAAIIIVDPNDDTALHEICHLHYAPITCAFEQIIYSLNLTPLEQRLIMKRLDNLEEQCVVNLIETFKGIIK